MFSESLSSMSARVITVNAGSSTLKLAAFDAATLERSFATNVELTTDTAATLEQALRALGDTASVCAVGHRVVHGGARFVSAALVTDEMMTALRDLVVLDPDHLPTELAIIEAMRVSLERVPHVACFDTAFHHSLPAVARRLAIPRRFEASGLRRYGFHGLSYTYLMGELGRVAPRDALGRVILAHLGAGASLAAVHDGSVVDTTMGFTPTSGIPMATRSGDLDPGVMLFLMRSMNRDAIDDLVNHESGLLGISQTTGDMRRLLALEGTDTRAAEAIELFCYQAKKAVGALTAAMGGVNTLVFSGGIGEHAAAVRARIAGSLEHLGIHIDETRNAASLPIISTDESSCTVRVIPTNEEYVIARQTLEVAAKLR
jgi:acetate kinase